MKKYPIRDILGITAEIDVKMEIPVNKKYQFLLLVFLTGAINTLADFLAMVIFARFSPSMYEKFAIAALAYVIIQCAILGRNAKCFDPAYFRNVEWNLFSKRLGTMGSVPIRMIGMHVVLHTLFLSAIFFVNSNYLGIDELIKLPLYLVILCFGVLVGTIIYVTSDALVTKTLVPYELTKYPRDFREKRQALKMLIIPLAVCVFALPYGSAIIILSEDLARGWAFILVPLLIFLAGITAMCLSLRRNTSTLYSLVIDQLENLSSEQKDLTRRISVCSVDELGTITGMINTFSEHLGDGIRDIKTGQKDLSVVGDRLEENAVGMMESFTRISELSEQALGMTQGQKDNVYNSSLAIEKIAIQIGSLERTIDTQASSMTEASAAVEEMVGNIASIGAVTEKMASQFRTVGMAAEEGSQIQLGSRTRISEIVEQSQSLQETNKIIATIAAQTNLLAMNAAIEAAHAGESGKGFSVVADEIRKLAENSAAESKKIGTELKQIADTITRIVKDAETTGSAFAEVSRRINDTQKLVTEVDNAIREQKTGAGEVMESLKTMNETTLQVRDGSMEIDRSNEAVLREIGALKDSAGSIAERMEEISIGIKTATGGAREVSSLSGEVHSSIRKISAIADSFEV